MRGWIVVETEGPSTWDFGQNSRELASEAKSVDGKAGRDGVTVQAGRRVLKEV
jgi:hypothetical protein